MLKIERGMCLPHLRKAIAFSKGLTFTERRFDNSGWGKRVEYQVNGKKHLVSWLRYVANIGKRDKCTVHLYKDFAPYSFYWEAVRPDGRRYMNGGLIYHGKHDNGGDGGAPTFSVCLDATDGWSVHT